MYLDSLHLNLTLVIALCTATGNLSHKVYAGGLCQPCPKQGISDIIIRLQN